MKRILVLAYYFPPMAFSGVQRIAKFTKYLPDFGFQPTVLTVDPHAYFAFDDALLDELDQRNIEIWRTSPGGPHAMMPKKKTISFGNERLRKLLNRISQAVYIPDNKVSWGKHVLEFLKDKDLSVFDAILCTGPPFSLFGTGVRIKQQTGIPLILDFRDAWLEYPYHRYITPWHKNQHKKLESLAIHHADVVVTTNAYVGQQLSTRYPDARAQFTVVTQGFDEDDFIAADRVELPTEQCHIVHTGLFYEDRTPELLYLAIRGTIQSNGGIVGRKQLHFHFVGAMQQEFKEMAQRYDIEDVVTFHGHVTHARSVGFLQAADAVWFTIGSKDAGFETVAPGKVYEYLGSQKPIIAVSPNNHVTAMLHDFPQARVFRPDDVTPIVDTLLNNEFYETPVVAAKQYSRRYQTARLAQSIALTLS